MKVDHSDAVSQACDEPLAKPSAPQRVNPSAPMRFQNPMCHPSVLGAGVCQFGCVSSMKSHEEIMKPVPPTTWGGMCVLVGGLVAWRAMGWIGVVGDGLAQHVCPVPSSISPT